MIVADASVIVAGLEGDGPSRLLLVEGDLHVPHIADQEVVHALRGLVRRGRASVEVATGWLSNWAELGVRRHPVTHLIERMWELRDNLSAYDAGYVALAESLECPLATGDRRIARAPGVRCETIVVDH
jgi:predicted nucleic acid-binding protein